MCEVDWPRRSQAIVVINQACLGVFWHWRLQCVLAASDRAESALALATKAVIVAEIVVASTRASPVLLADARAAVGHRRHRAPPTGAS